MYHNKNHIVCLGHAPVSNETNLTTESLLQHLSVAPPGERWCLDSLTLTDDGSTIAQAIQDGDAIAISDGSFHEQFGTASWVIEGTDSKGRIVGEVLVPGTSRDQSAYRSELAGIYSIMTGVKNICEFFKITSGATELGCDGQSAIDKAFNYVSIIRLEDRNYDLLLQLGLYGHPHQSLGSSDTLKDTRMTTLLFQL